MKTRSIHSARLATAPAEPTPPPRGGIEPASWCRGFGTHAWYIVPPMLVVEGGAIRVRLACHRCASARLDRWHPKTGAIEGRSYDPTDEYHELCEHSRAETRAQLVHDGKPQPISAAMRAAETKRTGGAHATNGTAMRLVSKGKGRLRDKPR